MSRARVARASTRKGGGEGDQLRSNVNLPLMDVKRKKCAAAAETVGRSWRSLRRVAPQETRRRPGPGSRSSGLEETARSALRPVASTDNRRLPAINFRDCGGTQITL
ncbi:unnamed protein product [Merluccius merluccius]